MYLKVYFSYVRNGVSSSDFIKSVLLLVFKLKKNVSDIKFDHVSNQWKAVIQEMN